MNSMSLLNHRLMTKELQRHLGFFRWMNISIFMDKHHHEERLLGQEKDTGNSYSTSREAIFVLSRSVAIVGKPRT